MTVSYRCPPAGMRVAQGWQTPGVTEVDIGSSGCRLRPRRPQEDRGRYDQERKRGYRGYPQDQGQRPRGPAPRAGRSDRADVAAARTRAALLRSARRGGYRAHPRCLDADPGRGRHRLSGRRGDRLLEGGARRRRRLPRAHRPRAAHGAGREGAGAVHPGGPQPRAQRPHRRSQHGVRAHLRLPVRARFRQHAPLQHSRRPARVPQAGASLAVHAPVGRSHLRAGGRRGPEAPPARRVQPAQALGQAVHGSDHGPRAGRGHRRDGADRVRRRLRREQHRPDRSAELQLAAGVGRDDARRAEGLRGEQPGGHRLPVRDGGGEHVGEHRRRGGPAQRGGARRGRVRAARARRRPDDLRAVPRHRGHAERGADGRHPRDQPDELHHRPARAPLPPAVALAA